MNHKEFQELSVRTESVVEEIKLAPLNVESFKNMLYAYVLISDILDIYKKHIFYGREIDYDTIMHSITIAHRSLTETNFNALKMKKDDDDGTFHNNEKIDLDPRVFHALLGTITEHGEIASALYNSLQNKEELDLVNVCEELGDSDWYKALFYEATNIDWNNVQEMIIKKLENRFSDKIFTEEEANQRDLVKERELLESHIRKQINVYKNK